MRTEAALTGLTLALLASALFLILMIIGSCASYAVPQACYARAADLADDYRAELKTLCRGYESDLESCPEFEDIEERFSLRRRQDAEACTP